jgi:transposase
MTSKPRRRRVEPTDELRWEQIELLCGWPEQRDYELIRPLVLFGSSSDERSRETGASSGRTLRRRAARFEAEGMESLFGSEAAKRRRLPPGVRRLIVDLKAEYPSFNPNEISRVCYVRFGRRPARKTVKRVLAEEPIPLRFVRRFPPYHEIPERSDGRAAVVALHADGWSVKAISGYLRVGTSTVYRVLKRWAEEGPEGLEDRPHGRPPGVRKVTLKAMEAIRRFQQNPHLGEFRIHAALAQIGIHLSPRTRGRILALNRELYGLEKPRGPVKEKREMPFAARRRHQFWSADVRYIDDHELGDRAYVISILDNHSRAILSSALTRTQDLASYLSVLYAAVERYGSPEALVTDGGGIFRARQARAVYEALGTAKHEIERGRPWQNFHEKALSCQVADVAARALRCVVASRRPASIRTRFGLCSSGRVHDGVRSGPALPSTSRSRPKGRPNSASQSPQPVACGSRSPYASSSPVGEYLLSIIAPSPAKPWPGPRCTAARRPPRSSKGGAAARRSSSRPRSSPGSWRSSRRARLSSRRVA